MLVEPQMDVTFLSCANVILEGRVCVVHVMILSVKTLLNLSMASRLWDM